jgi:hypothetical protein
MRTVERFWFLFVPIGGLLGRSLLGFGIGLCGGGWLDCFLWEDRLQRTDLRRTASIDPHLKSKKNSDRFLELKTLVSLVRSLGVSFFERWPQ